MEPEEIQIQIQITKVRSVIRATETRTGNFQTVAGIDTSGPRAPITDGDIPD